MSLHNDVRSVETLNMNKVQVKIFNHFVTALIDTGCMQSVLSERLLQRLRLFPDKLEVGDTQCLFGANGSRIQIIGKIVISIKLNGLTIPYDFLVAKQLTHDLILGHDFLTETKALINYSDNSITFFENLVELKLFKKASEILVYSDGNCSLPPRSETIVNVSLSQKLSGNNFLFEPVAMRENQKFLTAKILATVKDGRSICRILNATNQTIPLARRTLLATAQIIDSHHIPTSQSINSERRSYVNVIDEYQNSNTDTQFISSNELDDDSSDPSFTQGTYHTLSEMGIKIDNPNLTESQRQQLRTLLEQNSD